MSRWLPYTVLAAVIAVLVQLPPTNDAAWQLWIGRQLAGGAALYRDVLEVNPPLWFWLAVPIVELSDALDVSAWGVLLAFLGLSAALSIALVQRLKPGLLISLALVFAFFATGISATGQREQFTLIAVTPYVFLAAARAENRAVPLWFALLVGLWAAFGLALKHYFALVPLALELWLFALGRRSLRPEFLMVCAAGAIYAAAILLLMPDYLRLIVPIIGEAYSAYNLPLRQLLSTDVVATGVVALLGLRLAEPRSRLLQALAISGSVFLACYLLQQKGFRYHGLPALGLFSIMAIVAIGELDRSSSRNKVTALVLGLVPLTALATTTRQMPKAHPELARLCEYPRGTSILVLTAYGDYAWPAVETCDLRWTSRYMFLWMLPAIERNPDTPLAAQAREATVADISRHKPDVIIIEKKSRMGDPLAFVMADPRFRALLERYELSRSNEELEEWRRRGAAVRGQDA